MLFMQVLREFDHDDEGAILMSASSTKILRKKSRAAKGEREKKASEVMSTYFISRSFFYFRDKDTQTFS